MEDLIRVELSLDELIGIKWSYVGVELSRVKLNLVEFSPYKELIFSHVHYILLLSLTSKF